MRRAALFALLLLVLFAEADEAQDGIDALLDRIDLSAWDAWFTEQAIDAPLPSDYLRTLTDAEPKAAEGFTLESLSDRLLPALRTLSGKTALFLGFAVLGAAARALSDASSVGETAQAAFRLTACGAVLLAAFAAVSEALSAIRTVSHTAELVLPALVGFLALSGMENTALFMSASHAALCDTVLRIIEVAVAPCALIGGVLSALDAGAEGRLAGIGRLLFRAAKWALGTVCSLFLIVTAIRAVAAGGADGLLLKTTKFAAASIPSIGALLSESVDTAFLCLRVVRRALGLTGCVTVLWIAAKPVLNTVLTRCAFRAAALLSEPLAGRAYADLLRGMGDMLHILFLSELAAIASALLLIAPAFGTGA